MDDFAAARGISLVPVTASKDRPLGLPTNDSALADTLDAELEQARTALSALEERSAGERLKRVETQLLAHPHLPQAAFLMAECLALQAQAARERDPAQALALEARRAALEGPRASAFGERAAAAPAQASVALDVRGLGVADELELDGAAQPRAARLSLAPGLHHARVWRAGRPIFATFAEVTSAQQTLELAVPAPVPCGAEDLDAAARGGTPPAGIACEHWARVREEPAGIGVALCEHSHCGAFVHWQRRTAPPFTPIAVDRRRLPVWAGFVIAGATLAVASSLVLWQSGAFEHGHPSAVTWEYGGLNPQGVRF